MCACPGDEVKYECSVCSGAATLWSGTTLDCGPGDITLRHMNLQHGTFDYCNGNITSEIVGRVEDCYISRLEVTAVKKFNNTSINCSNALSSVGTSTLFIIPGI